MIFASCQKCGRDIERQRRGQRECRTSLLSPNGLTISSANDCDNERENHSFAQNLDLTVMNCADWGLSIGFCHAQVDQANQV
jgi:hypothetical protein